MTTSSTDETDGADEPTGNGPAVDEAALSELARDNAAFALDLHGALADAEGGNLFLSPYSVSAALAMVYAGARGETETRMRETLRYASGEDVHPAFAGLRDALESRATAERPIEDEEVDAFRLAIASAVWGRGDYPFAGSYLDLLEEYYGAGLRRAAFADDPGGARDRINEWVAGETNEQIEDLLPEGALDPSTVLVLANAVYFAAGWEFAFDPDDTESGTFAALDGTGSAVPMMHQHLKTNYASFDGGEAVELPYTGGEVSMVLVLPDEGRFEAFERDLDADALDDLFEALGEAEGDLRLPRFEYETGVQLSTVLSDLGMEIAFESGADFGGMVDGESAGLRIDEVYHEAFVSVDEEGTEAAAATAAVVEESLPPASFDLTFDRPFLFCIRDRPTGAVLFLGRVVDAGATG